MHYAIFKSITLGKFQLIYNYICNSELRLQSLLKEVNYTTVAAAELKTILYYDTFIFRLLQQEAQRYRGYKPAAGTWSRSK